MGGWVGGGWWSTHRERIGGGALNRQTARGGQPTRPPGEMDFQWVGAGRWSRDPQVLPLPLGVASPPPQTPALWPCSTQSLFWGGDGEPTGG